MLLPSCMMSWAYTMPCVAVLPRLPTQNLVASMSGVCSTNSCRPWPPRPCAQSPPSGGARVRARQPAGTVAVDAPGCWRRTSPSCASRACWCRGSARSGRSSRRTRGSGSFPQTRGGGRCRWPGRCPQTLGRRITACAAARSRRMRVSHAGRRRVGRGGVWGRAAHGRRTLQVQEELGGRAPVVGAQDARQLQADHRVGHEVLFVGEVPLDEALHLTEGELAHLVARQLWAGLSGRGRRTRGGGGGLSV